MRQNTVIVISLVSITIIGFFAIIGSYLLTEHEKSQVTPDVKIEHQEFFRIIDKAVESNDLSLCENIPEPRNITTIPKGGFVGDMWGNYPPQKDWIVYCTALVLDDITLCDRIASMNNVQPSLMRECKSTLGGGDEWKIIDVVTYTEKSEYKLGEDIKIFIKNSGRAGVLLNRDTEHGYAFLILNENGDIVKDSSIDTRHYGEYSAIFATQSAYASTWSQESLFKDAHISPGTYTIKLDFMDTAKNLYSINAQFDIIPDVAQSP